jgi:hypothetical protein
MRIITVLLMMKYSEHKGVGSVFCTRLVELVFESDLAIIRDRAVTVTVKVLR